MKKLVVFALALVTLNGMAQEKKQKVKDRVHRSELMKDMSPNDIADLKTKKLTLELDLSDKQQKAVHKVILEQAEAREKLRKDRQSNTDDQKEKPSKDEMVQMRKDRLDSEIEMKREMKAILTQEQYEKYEKMTSNKRQRGKKRGKKQ